MVCRLQNLITTLQRNLNFNIVIKLMSYWLVYTEKSLSQKSVILMISTCDFCTILYFCSTEFCFIFSVIPWDSVFRLFTKKVKFCKILQTSLFCYFHNSAEFRFPFTSAKFCEKYETGINGILVISVWNVSKILMEFRFPMELIWISGTPANNGDGRP